MPGRSFLFIKVIIKCIYSYNTYYNNDKRIFCPGPEGNKMGESGDGCCIGDIG
jgi:hypothetical protein